MLKIISFLAIAFIVLFFQACFGGKAKVGDMMQIDTSTAEERQLQIKSFQTKDVSKMLSSSIATLQDLGFNIDEINRDLGVVTASKSRNARKTSTQVGIIFLALLSPGAAMNADMQSDHIQDIKASVVVSNNKNKNLTYVRLTLQRAIKNKQGAITNLDAIKEPEIYKAFYEKLSKSVFLEANDL